MEWYLDEELQSEKVFVLSHFEDGRNNILMPT